MKKNISWLTHSVVVLALAGMVSSDLIPQAEAQGRPTKGGGGNNPPPKKDPPTRSGGGSGGGSGPSRPPKNNPPPRQDPPQRSNPPRQDPPQRSNPPRQDPPQRSNPPRQDPPQRSNPPRQDPPRRGGDDRRDPPQRNNPPNRGGGDDRRDPPRRGGDDRRDPPQRNNPPNRGNNGGGRYQEPPRRSGDRQTPPSRGGYYGRPDRPTHGGTIGRPGSRPYVRPPVRNDYRWNQPYRGYQPIRYHRGHFNDYRYSFGYRYVCRTPVRYVYYRDSYDFDWYYDRYREEVYFLGSTYLSEGYDYDVIEVNSPGIREILFEVSNEDAIIDHLVVEYDNGDVEEIERLEFYEAESNSGWIDLRGGTRWVKRIVVVGETANNSYYSRGQAKIEIFGRY